MTEDELNSLIAHAHRRIEQLQRHLAEQQALEQARMQTALEKQQEADEKIAQNDVQREQERLLAQFEVEKQRLVRISFAFETRTKRVVRSPYRDHPSGCGHVIQVVM